MNFIHRKTVPVNRLVALVAVMAFVACGRESSPEGRISIKLDRQTEIFDSLQQQNRAILDSLAVMRTEINELRQSKK